MKTKIKYLIVSLALLLPLSLTEKTSAESLSPYFDDLKMGFQQHQNMRILVPKNSPENYKLNAYNFNFNRQSPTSSKVDFSMYFENQGTDGAKYIHFNLPMTLPTFCKSSKPSVQKVFANPLLGIVNHCITYQNKKWVLIQPQNFHYQISLQQGQINSLPKDFIQSIIPINTQHHFQIKKLAKHIPNFRGFENFLRILENHFLAKKLLKVIIPSDIPQNLELKSGSISTDLKTYNNTYSYGIQSLHQPYYYMSFNFYLDVSYTYRICKPINAGAFNALNYKSNKVGLVTACKIEGQDNKLYLLGKNPAMRIEINQYQHANANEIKKMIESFQVYQ